MPPPDDAPRTWPAPTDDELAALDALGKAGSWTLGAETVKLTNLDKVLFPGRDDRPAVTKRDLVRYHAEVAPHLLPYLVDRPVNQHRFPDGVEHQGFWNKALPKNAPDWVARWHNDAAAAGETEWYVVVDRPATLAFLANQAALELHPWTSKVPDVRHPTWAYIDIDPGPKNDFGDVLTLARLYRTALDHLHVRAMPKVTGQRGVQIWVPDRGRPHLRRHARLGGAAVARDRVHGPRAGELGLAQGRPVRPGAPRLHPERPEQDAGGPLQRAARGRRSRVGAHRVGRARRPRAAPRPLDRAHRPRPHPCRGRPAPAADRPAAAAPVVGVELMASGAGDRGGERPAASTIDPMSSAPQADGRAVPTDGAELEAALEAHRRELTGFCYRMLGAGSEAEDAVQETMVSAWRAIDGFEGRSSLRTWLYRIANNVCIDMVRSPQRRARPMEMGPSTATADVVLGPQSPENLFVQPILDSRVIATDGDPADVATARESIRLAFVAALQHLPSRQRSVLILCEVLRWQATEVAELLDTSVASVNSALQRARATLASLRGEALDPTVDPDQQALLASYVDAFERYDIPRLVGLLRDDVVLSMPPWETWLQGPQELAGWFLGQGIVCKDGRLLPIDVNGTAGFGNYHYVGPGLWEPWAIQVIEVAGGKIVGHHNFLYPESFAEYGLPPRIEE